MDKIVWPTKQICTMKCIGESSSCFGLWSLLPKVIDALSLCWNHSVVNTFLGYSKSLTSIVIASFFLIQC